MIGTDRHTRTLDIHLARSPERKIHRVTFSQRRLKSLSIPPPRSISHPFPHIVPTQKMQSKTKRKKKDSKRYGFLTIDHDEQNVAKKEF